MKLLGVWLLTIATLTLVSGQFSSIDVDFKCEIDNSVFDLPELVQRVKLGALCMNENVKIKAQSKIGKLDERKAGLIVSSIGPNVNPNRLDGNAYSVMEETAFVEGKIKQLQYIGTFLLTKSFSDSKNEIMLDSDGDIDLSDFGEVFILF